jgi:hypothetical protein
MKEPLNKRKQLSKIKKKEINFNNNLSKKRMKIQFLVKIKTI